MGHGQREEEEKAGRIAEEMCSMYLDHHSLSNEETPQIFNQTRPRVFAKTPRNTTRYKLAQACLHHLSSLDTHTRAVFY
jgi:hypothetical protein